MEGGGGVWQYRVLLQWVQLKEIVFLIFLLTMVYGRKIYAWISETCLSLP